MDLPDIWYVEELPIAECSVVQRHTQMFDWFLALKDNIEEHGMRSPILVNNAAKRPYYIRCGNNRVQAAEMLGWTHVKAIVWGRKPSDDLEPAQLYSLEECQALLGDGIIEHRPRDPRDTLFVGGVKSPEFFKYPPTT